ncbi:sterol desaturase family protein [Rhodoflexus caldus]|uniref:sterol desaturase family protein n=1 Tax=Rhodoflexus caldus TaxID=2891236 RepID=UPI002029D95D|nr:sterol desaturase family protein [Rhodoflexus caldus]
MNAPTYTKPKNNGTKQLFQNPILEKLTRTHIAVPISLFIGISAGLIYYGTILTNLAAWQFVALFFVGLFVFSFVEYTVHRRVFHMEPDTPRKAKLQYTMHGVHHEYPKDKDRLAMPPLLSLTISSVLGVLFYWLMGDYMFGFLPGFLTGYAAYLFVHYAVHAFAPPKNFLKVLWINHGIHHYKDHDKAFGVSSPLWDWVFRTLP